MNRIKHFGYSLIIKDIRRTNLALKLNFTHKTESKTFVQIQNEYLD